jgi:hypothetical protein
VVAVALLAFSVTLRVGPGTKPTLSLLPQAEALDVVKIAWEKFREKVLNKVVEFIKSPVEHAKQGLKALIDGALKLLQKAFESDVILPALIWALPKVFPGAQKFLDYVRQIMGSIDRLTAMAQKYTAVVDALIQKNKDKFGQAMADVNNSMDFVQKFNVSMVIDILIAAAKEKAPPFIKSKTIELLDKAFSFVEAPIDAGKSAATAALGSIPIVGGLISGAADFVLTEGIKLIRQKGFEFIANKAVELANKAIDAIGQQLKGAAAAVDEKIKPVLDMVKGFLKEIEPYLAPLKTAYNKLKAGLEMANKGPGEMAAITLAKTLYGEFIDVLKKNAPAAKAKLQALADKAKTVLPAVGSLVGPILEGLGDATADVIDEAASCKDKIIGFNQEAMHSLFGCLRRALERGVAFGGFDGFINLLKTNVPQAKQKLEWLAGKLAAVFPPAKTLVGPITAGLDAGSSTLVGEAQKCRREITGLNKESAQGVLSCLGTALKSAGSAALAGAVKGLFDEFILLLRSGCDKAIGKLGELVSKVAAVVPQVQSVSGSLVPLLTTACEGGVDKIGDKLNSIKLP